MKRPRPDARRPLLALLASRALVVMIALFALIALVALAPPARALVSYDEGQRTILGVQLLRDFNDPNTYYYLPQFPRLATRADGSFEILCVKYVGANATTSGGLFHALVEFTLPPEAVSAIERELKKDNPAAKLAGAVPLLQAGKDGEEGTGSFEVVSALLADRGDGSTPGFTRSLVATDEAPLLPGSKAVVAAILSPQGATLLWDSLAGGTSDVSVSIHASYEAAVKSYNAKVVASTETVYSHFSRISNQQREFTKRQLRKVVDDLQRDGALQIEVVDRSAGLGIKPSDLAAILQLVTDKLIELMFDAEAGWAKDPEREAAVEANQILGRQERGWFSQVFGGAQDTPYFTDDQYVLKRRQDVRSNTFVLNLSQTSTIKVPVDTAGNLNGLYGALGRDPQYFRIVDLADPAFEFRTVHFQIDGAYADAFQDTVNFVTVNLRKTYPNRPAFTQSITFTSADIAKGATIQNISFPRLGLTEADWGKYEIQTRWSVRDRPTLAVPKEVDRWLPMNDAAVSLTPPFEKRVIEVDADRSLFTNRGLQTAVLEFASVLAGKPRLEKKATLRAADAATTQRLAVYHDRETPIALRASWHSAAERIELPLELVDGEYLFLTPPPRPAAPATPALPATPATPATPTEPPPPGVSR